MGIRAELGDWGIVAIISTSIALLIIAGVIGSLIAGHKKCKACGKTSSSVSNTSDRLIDAYKQIRQGDIIKIWSAENGTKGTALGQFEVDKVSQYSHNVPGVDDLITVASTLGLNINDVLTQDNARGTIKSIENKDLTVSMISGVFTVKGNITHVGRYLTVTASPQSAAAAWRANHTRYIYAIVDGTSQPIFTGSIGHALRFNYVALGGILGTQWSDALFLKSPTGTDVFKMANGYVNYDDRNKVVPDKTGSSGGTKWIATCPKTCYNGAVIPCYENCGVKTYYCGSGPSASPPNEHLETYSVTTQAECEAQCNIDYATRTKPLYCQLSKYR